MHLAFNRLGILGKKIFKLRIECSELPGIGSYSSGDMIIVLYEQIRHALCAASVALE